MKSTSLAICTAAVAVLAGCSMNSSTPLTAWGKKDITMLDYRTDAGQCALLAVTMSTDGNGANTAGGISGQNPTLPPQGPSGSGVASGVVPGANGPRPAAGSGAASGPTYRDSASADFVNRAANQQRAEEMAAQRARADALKFCLVNRGYTEFELTREQRAELAKLPQGSDERREYLYKLGTNEDVLTRQSVPRKRPR
jgi:hypothetical protein